MIALFGSSDMSLIVIVTRSVSGLVTVAWKPSGMPAMCHESAISAYCKMLLMARLEVRTKGKTLTEI